MRIYRESVARFYVRIEKTGCFVFRYLVLHSQRRKVVKLNETSVKNVLTEARPIFTKKKGKKKRGKEKRSRRTRIILNGHTYDRSFVFENFDRFLDGAYVPNCFQTSGVRKRERGREKERKREREGEKERKKVNSQKKKKRFANVKT